MLLLISDKLCIVYLLVLSVGNWRGKSQLITVLLICMSHYDVTFGQDF